MCWFPKTTLKFKSKSQTLVLPAPPNKPIFLMGTKGRSVATWPQKFTKFHRLLHKIQRYFMICTKPIFFRQESFSSPSLWEGFLSNSQRAKTPTIDVSHKADTKIFGKCTSKQSQRQRTNKDRTSKTSKRYFQIWCKKKLVAARRFNKFSNVLGFLVSNRL